MRKQIMCKAEDHIVNVAWLSFQPDGSISFGLNDTTFISPRLRSKIYIFNAYNRVKAEFQVNPTIAGLDPIKNPHFTYHPPIKFHLKGNKDETVFEGIADTTVILSQQLELQWIRAISKRIAELEVSKIRADDIDTECWVIESETNNISIRIAVDLLSSNNRIENYTHERPDNTMYFVKWNEIIARITIDKVAAMIPSLSWFHEY